MLALPVGECAFEKRSPMRTRVARIRAGRSRFLGKATGNESLW
jgi:hypothetical protein